MGEHGIRHKNLLDAHDCLLVIVDVQERFRPHIVQSEALIANIVTLAKAADNLDLPVVITEQYSRGLGPTVDEIKSLSKPGWKFFEKSSFSATGAPGFSEHLRQLGRHQIMVCGIETHVCVNQTVHELLQQGYQAHVIVDAVASRKESDKKLGLKKMFAAGALPGSLEMSLFEMLVESGTPVFKQVQSLVK